MQTLRQRLMRRPQRLLQLVELAPVILSFEIALDSLQRVLHALETRVQGGHLVARGEALQQLGVLGLGLRGLVGHLLDDVVGGLVDLLDARAEVGELLVRDARVVWLEVGGALLERLLLRRLLLLDWDGVRVARADDEFEHFECVRVFWRGCCYAEGVPSGERKLRMC